MTFYQSLITHPTIHLITYVTLTVCGYFLWEKKFLEKKRIQSNMIAIEDDHDLSDLPKKFSSLFSAAIEYGVLARFSFFGYKNSVSANRRIFSAISLTIFLLITFRIINILWNEAFSSDCLDYLMLKRYVYPRMEFEISQKSLTTSPVIFLMSVAISSFIIERKQLYEKWTYLANVYNKTIERTEQVAVDDPLKISLCIDVLDMEMWSHRSFRNLFLEGVASASKALDVYGPADSIVPFFSEKILLVTKENGKILTIKRSNARALLGAYHELSLFNKKLNILFPDK